MIVPKMPAPLVRILAWAATIVYASIVSPTPASAQSQVALGVGSTVRVVHTRCVLCWRRTSEGSIAAITNDSMQIARTRGLTGVALRDVRWIGTPAPISHTNGAIAGAQQGLVWGVLIGGTGAVVARAIGSRTQYNRTALVFAGVGASTLGGAVVGAVRKTTRWRRMEKHRWPNGVDSVSLRD